MATLPEITLYAHEDSCDAKSPKEWLEVCREEFLGHFKASREFTPVVMLLNKSPKGMTQIFLLDKDGASFDAEPALRDLISRKKFNIQAIFALSAEDFDEEGGPPIQLMVVQEGTPQNMMSQAFLIEEATTGGGLEFHEHVLSDELRLRLFPKNLKWGL